MDVTFNVNLNQIVDLNEKEQSLLLSLVEFEIQILSKLEDQLVPDTEVDRVLRNGTR